MKFILFIKVSTCFLWLCTQGHTKTYSNYYDCMDHLQMMMAYARVHNIDPISSVCMNEHDWTKYKAALKADPRYKDYIVD